MYYTELNYHIDLLKILVTYIPKFYIFQALTCKFPRKNSYCKEVSLCV